MASVSAKELFVLGRVSLRPTHGHEIMRTLRDSRADLWIELSEKHVYYILRKLDRDGLVTATEQRAGNLPARNVYAITDAGRTALAAMLSAGDLTRALPFSEFDVLLGMLSYTTAIDDAAKAAVLRDRRAALEAAIRDAAEAAAASAEVGGFPRMILDRVTSRLADELGWLESIEARVEHGGWAAMTPTFGTPGDHISRDHSPADGAAGAPRP